MTERTPVVDRGAGAPKAPERHPATPGGPGTAPEPLQGDSAKGKPPKTWKGRRLLSEEVEAWKAGMDPDELEGFLEADDATWD